MQEKVDKLNMKKIFYYDTKIGKIAIAEEDGQITNICFKNRPTPKAQIEETELIKKCAKQLRDYFEGKCREFDLPLNPQGTEFMKKVWGALRQIPYGQTRSYKDIAEVIGHKLAYRAVGMANNKNPIPIIIPCHRVIGTNKKLVGFAAGLEVKEYLLKVENQL